MRGRAARTAGIPGETLTFDASSDPGRPEVEWSGGGEPPTGRGARFSTRFATGGTYTVTARSGEDVVSFAVAICPLDEWLERARAFFGPSLDLSRVRITTSRLVLGPPGTGWTCNEVIRFKLPRGPEDLPRESTLIHELAHVWQHRTGQAQLLGGLVEQIGRRLGRDPYDYGGAEGVRRADDLTSFSKEAQAQIVTESWKSQRGHRADREGVPFSTPGYVDDLRRLLAGAGIGTVSNDRRTIASRIDGAVARIVNALLGG
jgi:hypothetical protein